MVDRRSLFVIFYVIIIVIICNCNATTTQFLKCTANDTRDVYEGCMLDYRNMALWCDRTQLTCVPDPNKIKSQAPCRRASYLFMNDSCLHDLNPEMLQKYVSLEGADFSKNLLTNISDNTFVSTNHMTRLDLSENYISNIGSDAFVVVYQLQEVKLYKNNLSRLQSGVFKNMTKLEFIDLNTNQLDTVDWRWFPAHSTLQTLILNGNKITIMRQPLPGQVGNLKVLKLDENLLQKLTRNDLAHMQTLQDIYLRRNQLKTIETDAFAETPNLVTVDLRDNQLHSLPENLFKNACYLQQLLLSGNNLVTINSDWFVNVLRHSFIYPTVMTSQALSDNKWTCDCKMLSYWEILQQMKNDSRSATDVDIFDIECSSPEGLRGSSLIEVSKTQLLNGKCNGVVTSSTRNQSSSSIDKNLETPVDFLLSPRCLINEISSTTNYDVLTPLFQLGSDSISPTTSVDAKIINQTLDESGNSAVILIVVAVLLVVLTAVIIVTYLMMKRRQKQQIVDCEVGKVRKEDNRKTNKNDEMVNLLVDKEKQEK